MVRLCLLFLLLILPAGCTLRQRAYAPPELSRPNGLVSLTPGDDHRSLDAEIVRSFAEKSRSSHYAGPGPKAKILALSGGGMYGAYSVGVLCGWTAGGTRPQFDVVTGVSTGSLIGTFAFLGPDYDRRLRESYTTINDRDIYRKRFAPAPLWRDSYARSEPLHDLIDRQLDDEVLNAVAREHQKGRRFYVGTTNIDTKRMVIWDMGAIAAGGRRHLYRDIILASSSPPGFLPPVPIEVEINGRTFTELHVDGGTTTGVFLRSSTLHGSADVKSGAQSVAGSDAYIIVAGKLYADGAYAEPRTIKIAEKALHSLIYSQTRSELFRIYSLCLMSGMNFHLTSIPEDFDVGPDAMGFDPKTMKRLYDAGFQAASSPQLWRDTPPGTEPHEQTKPRTGTQFLAPGR